MTDVATTVTAITSTQGVEQAMDVQMGDVQCDLQLPNERVAFRAALQVVPTTLPAVPAAPMEVETGQDSRCRLIWPHRVPARWSRRTMQNPTAVVSWFEEELLELATSLPAMRTIRHQPRSLRQMTCTVLKKLLQHHTHCHHEWVKRRDSESLKAELAAAR